MTEMTLVTKLALEGAKERIAELQAEIAKIREAFRAQGIRIVRSYSKKKGYHKKHNGLTPKQLKAMRANVAKARAMKAAKKLLNGGN